MIRKRRLCKQQATENPIENKSETENNATAKRKCEDLTLKTSRFESDSKRRSVKSGKTETCGSSETPMQLDNGESSDIYLRQTAESRKKADVTNEVIGQSNDTIAESGLTNDSGTDSTIDPDEDDSIEATSVETKADFDEPDCVSPESPWYRDSGVSDLNDLKNKKSSNPFFLWFNGKKGPTSTVYIQHDRATDSMDGDIFGVDIYTDESSKKKNYYRHFFVKVNPHSPADKMKIQYGDELVMVNDRFAPELDHKQIMDLFSRIPVDGVTRFALILRRQDPSKRSPTNKKWEWFETSAILVPELGKDPATKDLQYKKTGNFYDYEMSHRYKVIGEQNFLTLSKEGVGADILYGDKVRDRCKDIWKHAIVCEIGPDGEKLDYKASLSCADKTYYATINCNNVTVVETEVFFQYRKMGSEIYFKKGDSYLNCENRTVGASVNLQFFEEFGSPGHKDVVDGICKSANDVSGSVPGYPFRRITRSMSSQASFTTQFCNMSV